MVTVYIEVLIILIPLLLVVAWFLYVQLTKYIYNRRYKPENDKGKKGEEHREEFIRRGLQDTSPEPEKTSVNLTGQREPEGRSDVPTASSSLVGKNDTSLRKGSRRRGIFRRFRRR